MMSSLRRKWRDVIKYAMLGCVTLGLSTGAASAQQPDDPKLAELKARIERLEQQNQQLMQLLQSQRPVQPTGLQSAQDDTRKVVLGVLKEQEDKKKAEEEKKKAEEVEKGTEVGSLLGMTGTWRHGMWLESQDRAFRAHVGGRVQPDLVFMDADNQIQFGPGGTGAINDAFAFRRARFLVEGTMWDLLQFAVEFDFLNTNNEERTGAPLVANTPVPTDMWVQFDKVPWLGYVRVGNQKPMISFEHLTSSRWLNFLERSYGFDLFIGGLDNGFRPGIQAFNQFLDNRLILSAGAFKNQTSVFGFNTGDGEYDVTTRAALLPIYEDNGRLLLHLALGYSHRDLDDDQARFRARTSLRNGPAVLHTVLADIRVTSDESQDLFVPEIAGVCGPFSFQAEYFWSRIGAAEPIGGGIAQDAKFTSWYVEGHYFLTGEHRPYNKMLGVFDRVIPNEPYFFTEGECGNVFGKGAWQIAARYGEADLSDGQFQGGHLKEIVLGLNWMLNPNLKFQWNYIWNERQGAAGRPDGEIHGFGMRMALDF
jgi:phosphate-selective porin OprO and OprP